MCQKPVWNFNYYIKAVAEKERLKTMEEAKDDEPETVRQNLSRLWEYAKTTEDTKADTEYIRIGLVSDRLNEAMSKALGKKVKAEIQYIRPQDVRHIDEIHGIGNEAKPEQIPVTKEMFMLLRDVLKNFDEVAKGNPTAGRDSVKITKCYLDGRIVIANAILLKGDLAITMMLAKKPATSRS